MVQASLSSGIVTSTGSVKKTVWMWSLGTWFNGEHGAGLMVGLDGLRRLFQT